MKLKELYKLSQELGINIVFRNYDDYGVRWQNKASIGNGSHFKVDSDLHKAIEEIEYLAEKDGFTDFYLYV